jgi:O-antigen ligase
LIGLGGGAGLFWLWGERFTNSTTIIGRLYVWQGSLTMWLDHLWLGVGPGRFVWRYPAYVLPQVANDPNLLHPHNVWLEAATGGGILGLIWLGAALVVGVRLVRHQSSALSPVQGWLRAGVAAGLVAGLAHAQVDAFAALPDLAVWNWLAFGVLAWQSDT